jgi:pyruvate dehydrogenase E2 component (dihydrolipoamide acetyltransferase)
MSSFLMPSLGADMEDGTVVEWLKNVGDTVERGDVVAVVETVKGAIEIEIFEDGVLDEIVAAPGTTIAVGDVLALINDGKTSKVKEIADEEVKIPDAIAKTERSAETVGTQTEGQVRASPAARERARELGVEIAAIPPGPGGVIGLSEVEAASVAKTSKPAAPISKTKSGLDLDAMRKAIGAAMERSKREIPHYYVSSTLDVTNFVEWLTNTNSERTVADRLLYAAPLLKAVAIAIKDVPELNGLFEQDERKPNNHVHIGLVTALRGGGLIAPAIHDADTLSTSAVMSKMSDVVARVRSGRLRGSEIMDPTISLSILGEATADSLFPIIYPPQVAIIGCGAVRLRPWIVDDKVVPRQTLAVTVAGDHRVSDGRAAGRFLNRLDQLLNEPEKL